MQFNMAAILENMMSRDTLSNEIPCTGEAVPNFLNFIREQCNWLTGTSFVDALTAKYRVTMSNNIREQTEKYSGCNHVPDLLSQPLKPFKGDDKFVRKPDVRGSRQNPDKHNGCKQNSKNKDNKKKYVKLTEVPKQNVPNISDHTEFPLISEISPPGIKVASLLEKRLKGPINSQNNLCTANKSERCDAVSNTSHLSIFKTSAENQERNRKTVIFDNHISYDAAKQQNETVGTTDNFVIPSIHLVTDKEKLDKLVSIYCSLFDSSQVPNVSVELYFLFSLLTARDNAIKDKTTNDSLLNTVHNCVYFATSVLNKQISLLEVLDRTTLHTLCEMPYLQEFSDLKDQICSLCEKKKNVTQHRKSSIQGVSFQADTDNRRNFPNDNAFQTFRKQRDFFYELLRDWKEQHFSPSWTPRGNFASRVKHIINLSCTSTNFAHLARLIQSHLITACDNGFVEFCNSGNDEIAALKRSFPDKFEKLQERFQVPLKGRGPCPPPYFYGSQEFLRDFLEAAGCASLNQHLIGSIVAKIVELNQSEFTVFDCKIQVDEILREKFFCCLHSLRTLAKFLGYLVFMPYQNIDLLSADIINCQCVIRNTCQPPLNVYCLLLDAVKNNRLILTVPWIAEYLSMMDPVAQHLDYYHNMFSILFKIHKSELNTAISSRPMNKHFLKLILGWLFETPNFPVSDFFLQVNNNTDVTENCLISEVENLDALEIIDENIIYSCCPYLSEFRVMLEEYLTGIQRRGQEVRKINPVSADSVDLLCIAQLENKLEDNFFHLQSPSVKKTVEFVAERISSKAIHHIRNELIPSVKENSLMKIESIIDKAEVKDDITKLNGSVSSVINENANSICCEMKNIAMEFAKSFCGNEIKKVMPFLLQKDLTSEVIQICCDLSYRISIEKVLHWTRTYVTVSYISMDMKIEIEKLHKKKPVPNRKLCGVPHSTTLTTDFVISLKDKVKEISYKRNVCTKDVLKLLSEIRSFVSNQELLPAAIKLIGSITVDYAVFLLAYQPNIFTEEVVSTFNNLWCEVIPHSTEVSNLLSVRNVSFISRSPDAKSSWCFLRLLLVKLLQCNRITARELETNCMKIVKQEWSDDTMYNFSNFLKELLCWYRMQSSKLEFVEIMTWLSWFCEPSVCN